MLGARANVRAALVLLCRVVPRGAKTPERQWLTELARLVVKSGWVDGAENNWPSYFTSRHFEVAKQYALTEHSLTPEILAMSKRSFDRQTVILP